MIYKELYGDLFEQGSNKNLAHCVSADFRMSRGIARTFRERFGGIEELITLNATVGDTVKLTRDDRYIFYLITKEKYFHKPTLRSLKQCLLHLKKQIIELGIISLDIPKIAAGLDKIPWTITKQLLLEVFFDLLDFQLTVWYQ